MSKRERVVRSLTFSGDRLLRLGEEKKARAKKKQTEAKAARELAEYERLKQKFEREGSHEGSS